MYYLKKKDSERKAERKTDYIKRLDKEFSLYIRLRDSKEYNYKFFRCISCGQIKPFDKGDCGHFYSRKNMSTRYSELNCSCECSYCNRFKADHMIYYRENLIKKIGRDNFDILSVQSRQTRKYADFELKVLIKHYKELNYIMLKEKSGM